MEKDKSFELYEKLGFIFYEGYLEGEDIYITYISDGALKYVPDKEIVYQKNFFKNVLANPYKDFYSFFLEKAKKMESFENLYKFFYNNKFYWALNFAFFDKQANGKIFFYGYLKDLTIIFNQFIEKKEISEYSKKIYALITTLLEKDDIDENDVLNQFLSLFDFEKVAVLKYGKNNINICVHNFEKDEAEEIQRLVKSENFCGEKYRFCALTDSFILVLPKEECEKIIEDRFNTIMHILNILIDYSKQRKRLKSSIIQNMELLDELHKNYEFLQHILNNLQSGVCIVDEENKRILSNEVYDEYFEDVDFENLILNNNNIISQKGIYFKIFVKSIRIQDKTYQMILAINVTDIINYEQAVSRLDRLAAIGQLTAGIAHDFNNILTGIIGMNTALKMIETDDKKLRYLDNIGKLVDKAAEVIRQLLDFARHSEGTPQYFELKSFLKEFVKMLESILPKKITVELNFDASEKYVVYLDPVQLDRILMNICVNAKDAIGEDEHGKIEITLYKKKIKNRTFMDLVNIVKNGDYIVIKISDDGCGIPENLKKKVFEPYVTTKEDGNGLGLAQVYGLVKNNDGYITFESVLGKGTSFYVLFPESKNSESQKKQITKSKKVEDILKEKNILIVDDEKYVVETIKLYLEQYKCHVDFALSGKDGLKMIEQAHYDLVITDYYLPDVEFDDYIRLLQDRCERILVISGYKVHTKLPVLSKPFDSEDIINKICEMFSN